MSLMDAIRTGDVNQAAQLLDANASLASERTPEGVSYISLAMYHRQPEIAHLIASRRQDLDLPEACAVGDAKRVRELISSDPGSVNSYSVDGFTPIALAAFFGHPDVVEILANAGADIDAQAQNPMKVAAIHAAVAARDARCVEILLQNGANPNLTQQNGITPLHVAQVNKDEAIIHMLTAAGGR